jgi:SanA protein
MQTIRRLLSTIRRRPWRSLLLLAGIFIAAILLCDLRVSIAAQNHFHTDVASTPEAPVALLLGTSKKFHGRPNGFYTTRIKAAADLFKSGKIRGILVSGDNAERYYNEPKDMLHDLVAAGVPEKFITLDYAGFRTLDSVVRAKEVFGQEKFIIVSQKFHVQRAIYLARQHGIDATGYIAADPPSRKSRFKIRAREILARTASVFDVLTGRAPKFLGDKETVALR